MARLPLLGTHIRHGVGSNLTRFCWEEKIAPVTVAALAQICEFDARVSDDHSGDRFISAMSRDQDRQQLTELGGDGFSDRLVAQVKIA